MSTPLRTLFTGIIAALLAGCSEDLLRKGTIALELGDYPLAISFFSKRTEQHPGDAAARIGLGKAYLQKAADNPEDTLSWRSALRNLEAAHTLKKSDSTIAMLLAQAWTERGKQLLFTKDTVAAIEALSRSIAIDKRYPEPLNLAGIVYYQTGNASRARLLFERALTLDTAHIPTLFNLGMLNWEASDIAAAHALWLRALNHAPEDAELVYWFSAAEKRLREMAVPGTGGDSVQ